MKDIFFIDDMLTPKIITFVYWILLVSVTLSGLSNMFGEQGSFFEGLVMIVGGAILARTWCELLIVLFKIHENIKVVADATNAPAQVVVEQASPAASQEEPTKSEKAPDSDADNGESKD